MMIITTDSMLISDNFCISSTLILCNANQANNSIFYFFLRHYLYYRYFLYVLYLVDHCFYIFDFKINVYIFKNICIII